MSKMTKIRDTVVKNATSTARNAIQSLNLQVQCTTTSYTRRCCNKSNEFHHTFIKNATNGIQPPLGQQKILFCAKTDIKNSRYYILYHEYGKSSVIASCFKGEDHQS